MGNYAKKKKLQFLVLSLLSILGILWNHPQYQTNDYDNNDQIALPANKPPKKLRVVFVGDSLTRFNYLSLAYYFKYNEWAPPGIRLLEKVKDTSPNQWNDWLQYTNDVLKPETCDCYRHWSNGFNWKKHVENRYFQPSPDVFLAFLTKFGQYPFHGHWNPHQIFQRKSMNMTLRPFRWSFDCWNDLIDQYIIKLKPDYMVFNQGHWKYHDLKSHTVLQSIQTSLQNAGIVGIYRTTTFRRDEDNFWKYRNEPTRKHDFKVCEYFPCLNVSWTAETPPEEYVDDVHFAANINNQMAQQLMEFLDHLKTHPRKISKQ